MSHRIGADPDARRGAELLHAIEPRLSSGDERGGTATVRGTNINELVQIVVTAGQAQDRSADQNIADRPDREPIRFSSGVNVIYRRSTGGALLVLDDDRGFAGDIFFKYGINARACKSP